MYFFLLSKTSFDIMKHVVGLKGTSPTFKETTYWFKINHTMDS